MKRGPLVIYVDRLLKEGFDEKIFESLDPALLDLEQKELTFTEKVCVDGKAYVASHHVILCCKIKTKATVPCCICNQKTEIPIYIKDFSLTIELSAIPSAIYDFSEEVRTSILLNVPHFTECSQGNCPSRTELSKFFKTTNTHSPFSEL